MYAPETLITSNKLFQLWHIDPKGDSGPPCRYPGNWKLHISHWHFKLPIWTYTFRWKHLEKCAWCGERGSKKNPVNITNGRVHFHALCSSKQHDWYHQHTKETCWPCKHESESKS